MHKSTNNDLIKDDVVETPEEVSQLIYDKVKRKKYKTILDVGGHKGSLSKPFKNKKDTLILGIDIVSDHSKNFTGFLKWDYLETEKKDYPDLPDLVISNPPFSDLLSWKFIEHTLKIFGDNQPSIFIVPQYILNNATARGGKLNNINITKIIHLPPSIFKNAAIHCSVIFININFKSKSVYEYYVPTKEIKGKVRSLFFTKSQEEWLKENKIKNFTKFIKDTINKEYPDFP